MTFILHTFVTSAAIKWLSKALAAYVHKSVFNLEFDCSFFIFFKLVHSSPVRYPFSAAVIENEL